MTPDAGRRTAWLPDLLFFGGSFRRDLALVTDDATGRVVSVAHADDHNVARVVRLKGRALLPGMVNAHSHGFQRVIRGRTEFRTTARDTFWTWREQMYSAASRLTPEQLYDASRMAFLEMALGGITTVGEFHYLHRDTRGNPYDDPNLLAGQVVRAARDVGIRIALLRTAYARSGFNAPPNERQSRFITRDPHDFIKHTDALRTELARADDERATDEHTTDERSDARTTNDQANERANDQAGKRADERAGELDGEMDGESRRDGRLATAWVGVAPHSLRAVPLEYWREINAYARAHSLPVHAHIAEQPAETEACLAEYGRPPVLLLDREGLINERFTAVHAIHVADEEARALARARAHVCACPTTERNLGDGVFPADLFFDANVRVALGTDSHAQIDLLEDARELELNLRLAKLSRAVLAPPEASARNGDANHDDTNHSDADHGDAGGGSNRVAAGQSEAGETPSQTSALAARLFECATRHGASSVGACAGALAEGRAADFFTVALDDPSIAGARAGALLASVVFSLTRAAVRDVCVGGRLVVEDGRHASREEIVRRFAALQRELWS